MRAARRFVLAGMVLAMVFSGQAGAAPDSTATVPAGTTYSWNGAAETNSNVYYFRGTGRLTTVQGQEVPPREVGPFSEGACAPNEYQACDDVLVELSNPLTQAEIDQGKTRKNRTVTIELTEMSPAGPTDFDFQVFKSDVNGTKGEFWTGEAASSQSGNFNADPETPDERLVVGVETTTTAPSKWMLIRVVRYASINSTYKGAVKF